MASESLIVGEMMIGGEEGNDTLWVHFTELQQTVDDRGCRTSIAGLDQHS
jgi:hypothetical protein